VRDSTEHDNAAAHYGLLWWNNADGAIEQVPADTYWSWGLYDSLIVVVPRLEVVVARAGRSWPRQPGASHYAVLKPFLQPIAEAATGSVRSVRDLPGNVSRPQSPVIEELVWAPASSIIRLARGSDTWPLTWADDDALYSAYGDGSGFDPASNANLDARGRKLSLGVAKIRGAPPKISGENIHAPTVEAMGDGEHGRKASGILSVDGALFLWVRNVNNSQLAWSSDHGETWQWADWKFVESFGCPTFLNFGRDYADARDEFVYIYSPDTGSAYQRADRMVLARAPRNGLRDRRRYEFFRELSPEGQPIWSADITRRGAVFSDPNNCYRSHVTYNLALKRYLWCQTGRGVDTRFAGGLAVYDAPEPWGPWSTVFRTESWDVGPGESSSFPSKWISADGCTVYLVFSGDDSFSVRRGTLRLREPGKK